MKNLIFVILFSTFAYAQENTIISRDTSTFGNFRMIDIRTATMQDGILLKAHHEIIRDTIDMDAYMIHKIIDADTDYQKCWNIKPSKNSNGTNAINKIKHYGMLPKTKNNQIGIFENMSEYLQFWFNPMRCSVSSDIHWNSLYLYYLIHNTVPFYCPGISPKHG